MRKPGSRWPLDLALGAWAPGLILLTLVLDLGLRLTPLGWWSFRAWEAVQPEGPSGPFAPLRHYRGERCYGDLAGIANLPELRQYHPEEFTTDAYGFRNPPEMSRGPVAALLDGDSFAAGSGLMDHQTLSALLTARSGRAVYNVAGHLPSLLPDLRRMARALHMERGLVIYEHNERTDLPGSAEATRPRYELPSADALPLREALARRWEDVQQSRLEILAGRAARWLRFDGSDDRVIVRRLVNGEQMLLWREDIERWSQPPTAAAYWVWLKRELQRDGLDLLVVLVPSKYTVYAPLLRSHPVTDAPPIDRLAAALAAAGVPTVNLAPAFRERAVQDLQQGRYLYWRDDTHWNAEGVALAAELITQATAGAP